MPLDQDDIDLMDGIGRIINEAMAERDKAIADLRDELAKAITAANAAAHTRDLQIAAFLAMEPVAGKDGVDGAAGKDGADGKDGAAGRDGLDGAKGLDGANGRDGMDRPLLDLLTTPDAVAKQGQVVPHDGGLFIATRDAHGPVSNDPLSYRPLVVGLASMHAYQDEDDPRVVVLTFNLTGGVQKQLRMKLASRQHKGRYENGTAYQEGDEVAWNGCSWVAKHDGAATVPGEGADWHLAAKQGKTGQAGKDGGPGQKGVQGIKGERGQDGVGIVDLVYVKGDPPVMVVKLTDGADRVIEMPETLTGD